MSNAVVVAYAVSTLNVVPTVNVVTGVTVPANVKVRVLPGTMSAAVLLHDAIAAGCRCICQYNAMFDRDGVFTTWASSHVPIHCMRIMRAYVTNGPDGD